MIHAGKRKAQTNIIPLIIKFYIMNTQQITRLYQLMNNNGRGVKPVSSFKNNLLSFFFSLPLSINLRASIWDVPLHLMWQQLARGLLSLWADGRSTPLIPIHTGWMEKTEGSVACGSNRPASPPLWPLSSPFFIGEEGRGGEEGTEGGKSAEVLVFPWECSLGGQGFFVEFLS